jgi:hypothetical protein
VRVSSAIDSNPVPWERCDSSWCRCSRAGSGGSAATIAVVAYYNHRLGEVFLVTDSWIAGNEIAQISASIIAIATNRTYNPTSTGEALCWASVTLSPPYWACGNNRPTKGWTHGERDDGT